VEQKHSVVYIMFAELPTPILDTLNVTLPMSRERTMESRQRIPPS